MDRKRQTIENLEKMGGKSNEKLGVQNVKTFIMQLLKKSKSGTDPSNEEISHRSFSQRSPRYCELQVQLNLLLPSPSEHIPPFL